MTEYEMSLAMEELLVARNPRQMAVARAALRPGYVLRAAAHLRDIRGTVLIGTGFPVAGTFETDGPVGAMALYAALTGLGAEPLIVCGPTLAQALGSDYRVLALSAQDDDTAHDEAARHLGSLQPAAIIAIEHPGAAADGRYYNMRGEDISAHSSRFDPFFRLAACPTIGIGDGGNEIGMGNIAGDLSALKINACVTACEELLVADVSNWGAYALIAWLGHWARRDILAGLSPTALLHYLSVRGSVDGVSGENSLTEDGLPASEGLTVIGQLRALTGFVDD